MRVTKFDLPLPPPPGPLMPRMEELEGMAREYMKTLASLQNEDVSAQEMRKGLKKLGIDVVDAHGGVQSLPDRGRPSTAPSPTQGSWRKPEVHKFSLTKQSYLRTDSDLFDQKGKQAGTRAYIRPSDIMGHVFSTDPNSQAPDGLPAGGGDGSFTRRQLRGVASPKKLAVQYPPGATITTHDYGEREAYVRSEPPPRQPSEQEDLSRKHAKDNERKANLRLEQRLRTNCGAIRTSLALMDAAGEGAVGYSDFKAGLRGGGVVLGEADYLAAWAYAGGGQDVEPEGKIVLAPFLSSIEAAEAGPNVGGIKREDGQGGRRHSQLAMGSLQTRDDAVTRSERYGKSPNSARNASGDVIKPDLTVRAEPGGERVAQGLSKWEMSVKETLQGGREAVKRAFGVGAKGEGKSLLFDEFQQAVEKAGVRLGRADVESVWRKADADCVGRVTYQQLASAFGLSDYVAVGEPGGSRFLPHFASEEDGRREKSTPWETGTLERVGRLTQERVAQSVSAAGGGKGVVRHLDAHGGLAESQAVSPKELRAALSGAGAVVSEGDAAALIAAAAGGGGAASGREVMEVLRAMEARHNGQSHGMRNEDSLRGFGMRQVAAGFAGGAGGEEAVAGRVAASQVGNSHRLRRMFRQVDMDRSGTLSNTEFLHALTSHGVSLSQGEAEAACRMSDAGRGVVSYETFIAQVTGEAVAGTDQARGIVGSRSTPAAGSITSRREERQQHTGKRRLPPPATQRSNILVPEGGGRAGWLSQQQVPSRREASPGKVLRLAAGPPPPLSKE